MRIKYTKEMLEQLVKESFSVAQVIKKLGLKQAGGTHCHLSRKIKKLEIDSSHFLGQAYNSGANYKGGNTKKSASEILIIRESGPRQKPYKLRRALLEIGVKYECEICYLKDIWNGKEIRLEVDHKNNNWLDDRKENLRFLCPNCHSQQQHKMNKGKTGLINFKSYNKKVIILKQKIKNINKMHEYRIKSRKVERPSKEELFKLLWELPTTKIANQYGVSDKAVEKWSKSYNIQKPPRGYWAKQNRKN